MLHFSDHPYEFYPPKPNRFLMWLGREMNRRRSLPGSRHRMHDVVVQGQEQMGVIKKNRRARILYLPNHSTHSDAEIMTEVQRQVATPSCFMAAYDVFTRNKLEGWMMQRLGAFSVDRDAGDTKSMKTAMQILRDGTFALTIFPEGNVHFTNDLVTNFLEGAAFIAMKAQKELKEQGTIYAVPVSIKATHLTDQRESVRGMIQMLADEIGTEFDKTEEFSSALTRIGVAALERNLRQRGFGFPDSEGKKVSGVLGACAERILATLEEKMEVRAKPNASLEERAKRLRSQIHRIRIDPDAKAQHHVAISWADEAMLALRVLSYSGGYLTENSTLDRFAETVEKLLEDTYSEMRPPIGDRTSIVQINQPIDLADRLEDFAKNPRGTLVELTSEFESSVQSGLDAINRDNPHQGGEPFMRETTQ